MLAILKILWKFLKKLRISEFFLRDFFQLIVNLFVIELLIKYQLNYVFSTLVQFLKDLILAYFNGLFEFLILKMRKIFNRKNQFFIIYILNFNLIFILRNILVIWC